jgi:AcrR family transcriptional regulator
MTSLREKNKAKRRDAILDATLELLQREPAGTVTTEDIAERAEVSPATVYNLVGTREQLYFALVDRANAGAVSTADELSDDGSDLFERAAGLLDAYIDTWTAKAAAWRQIVMATPEASMRTTWMTVDPATPIVELLTQAQTEGRLRADARPYALGQQVFLSYIGAMFAWTVGAQSNETFTIAARHGLLVVLAGAAVDEERPALLAQLGAVSDKLNTQLPPAALDSDTMNSAGTRF